MSLLIIGFGGTGAKMVQSFVMLAASGALKLAQPVKILLVDQDRGNGNTQRTAETIESYRAARRLIAADPGAVRPFNVDIQIYSEIIWQPLMDASATLGRTFRHNDSAADPDLTTRLLDVLYTREQLLETTLDKGFRGNPNIGAPVFADRLRFDAEPWRTVDSDLAAGIASGSATVVLCGSIFGGTGAAGIPSTCKVLRQRLKQVHRDGANNQPPRTRLVLNLAMPYFSIREEQNAGLQADGAHFLANSKSALQYYFDAHYLDFCDAMYLLGEQDPAPIDVAKVGDAGQRNAAHPLELFAACNIAAAFNAPKFNADFILTQRTARETYAWDDLPLNGDAAHYPAGYVRARIGAFARMCFALEAAAPALDTYKASERLGDHAWLLNYFPRSASLNSDELKQLRHMAKLFLVWAGELELSADSMSSKVQKYGAEWFDPQPIVAGSPRNLSVALTPIDPEKLSGLVRPVRSEERYSYRTLHHDLQRKPAAAVKPGLAGFVCDLYRESGKTLTGFAGSPSETDQAEGATHA